MKVRVTVFSACKYDGDDWPTPGYAAKFMPALAWFHAKLALIPEEFRADAVLDIYSAGGYADEHYPCLEIWYDRPETAEETARREADEKAKADQKRAQELATLRALQAKYPAK